MWTFIRLVVWVLLFIGARELTLATGYLHPGDIPAVTVGAFATAYLYLLMKIDRNTST